ncbi:MAG TPA: hypothetical protein VMG34_12670 [Bacteroidota bacterium]|nr:hypothetical protein [Bacteroidota bacterium]
MDPVVESIGKIRQALADEAKARAVYPARAILTNGIRAAVLEGSALYRFEVPENFLFEPTFDVRCSIGSKLRFSFPAIVADTHHQFVFFLFPFDMGETIGEVACEWSPSEGIDRLASYYKGLDEGDILTALVARDFSGVARPSSKEPIFPSTFTQSQRDAVRNSMSRRISVIVGERKRGKTGVAASLMFSAIREGKRVLYLTPSSGGLHDCMKEVAALNPVVAEESILALDPGLTLLPPLPMPSASLRFNENPAALENLRRLTRAVSAEHEYDRAAALAARVAEKQQQVEEAAAEGEELRAELARLQGASMIERMKLRIGKADIDRVQAQLQDKLALVDRLKEHASTLLKDQFRKESQFPVPLKEKRELEKLLSQPAALEMVFPRPPAEVRCVAATLRQALSMKRELLGAFDVVCIDDAHALSLAEFFWAASNAKGQCFILADAAEQPPQSISQGEPSRVWLQKNYLVYLQGDRGDLVRFSADQLPPAIASALTSPEAPRSLFVASLESALDAAPLPPALPGRVYVVNTQDQRGISEQYLGKKKILPFNDANGRKVVECVKHALLSGTTSQEDILVVVPPSGQATYLRELLRAQQMTGVEVACLGSLRLCSKRSVVFDTTVAGVDFTLRHLDEKKLGLVRMADTLNTLLSTVREDLYIVADLAYFGTRYKDRLVTKIIGLLKYRAEIAGNIPSAVRRFDDLAPELRKKVLFLSSEEKQGKDYAARMEQARAASIEAAKSGTQQSIAMAERKLKSDAFSAVLRVIAKREVVNTIAQYLEAFPLYRSTSETMTAAALLPELECDNENDFKRVMNLWNLLIYETSDAEKIDHPLASKARVSAKLASDMQQLHAYYHSDLEFVVEVGKHKLAQSVQQIFNDCIGKRPVTPSDWMKAYLVFLGRMEKYLETVVNQIRK